MTRTRALAHVDSVVSQSAHDKVPQLRPWHYLCGHPYNVHSAH